MAANCFWDHKVAAPLIYEKQWHIFSKSKAVLPWFLSRRLGTGGIRKSNEKVSDEDTELPTNLWVLIQRRLNICLLVSPGFILTLFFVTPNDLFIVLEATSLSKWAQKGQWLAAGTAQAWLKTFLTSELTLEGKCAYNLPTICSGDVYASGRVSFCLLQTSFQGGGKSGDCTVFVERCLVL